ncbi:MAG: YitT family protein [Pararhodobacter sp.]|nr:YitT family protein [Pararhodobacter sp.]
MTGAARHTALDDAQGLAAGALLCAFGVLILTSAGLMTGQTAGLAVLVAYATGWPFAAVFFVINLPFYGLALARMGLRFTLKTFAAVTLLSGVAVVLPDYVAFDRLHPGAAALLFGAVTGAGLLAIFRHGASLGGVGIVALMAQERLGWQAGWVQLGFDALLFMLAFLLIDPGLVLYSLFGAVVVNAILGINHRRDRYIGT